MARNAAGRTRVEDVYQSLRDEIYTGRLEPGQRVNLGELAKAYKVSLTVVREAATRLAAEHLMQATPQQGFRVWPLSVSDLMDLTRVRIEIESLVLRESVTNGDLDWEADLVAAHHKLAGVSAALATAPSRPNQAWIQAHSQFHAALAAACQSPRLKQLRQQLFDSAELYRRWTSQTSKIARPKEKRSVHQEHKELLDAALEHDADAAVELATGHIQRTADVLLETAEDRASSDG